MRLVIVAAAVALALSFVPLPLAEAATFTVEARDNAWVPSTLTVAVGDTVNFVKTGANPHSLSSTFKNCPNPMTNCSHTFTAGGTYTYVCGVHGFMTGSITVNAGPPPSISITSPAEGATVSGTITVSGTASPPSGATITKVEVKVDVGGTYATATGTTSWSKTVDTSTLSNGAHRIYAKATASNGGTKETWRNVTVNNPVTRDLQPIDMFSTVSTEGPTKSQVTVTVRNNGNTASGAFALKLEWSYKGGRQLAGTIAYDSIAAFSEASKSTSIGDNFHYGRFDVVATADHLGQVAESNEANNAMTESVTVVTGLIQGQDLRDPRTT